jgi:hypothetical protein
VRVPLFPGRVEAQVLLVARQALAVDQQLFQPPDLWHAAAAAAGA